jgi:hypothetical protein
VTGGGLAADTEQWVASQYSRFLFPVRVMSALFRGKFMAAVIRLYDRGQLDLGGTLDGLRDPEVFQLLKGSLYRKRWVVYAKQPFGGPKQVFAYLGLYTHRVGISNRRILAIDAETVRFRTRSKKTVTLPHREFLRRLVLHVLPKGFVKIRHYGLLAPRHAETKLQAARAVLENTFRTKDPRPNLTSTPATASDVSTFDSTPCPICAQATLLRLLIPTRRPPPPPAKP